MKILKIFGLVVGIHVFALILIFANPGCSSTTRPRPAVTDTLASSEPSPTVTVPPIAADSAPPVSFDPNAPAVHAGGSVGVRYSPTRPGTPAAATVIAEPVADVTPATTYTVQSGDNLWNIAKKHKVSTTEIAAANGMRTNAVLRPGQKLIIPGKPASPTVAARSEPVASLGKSAETVTAVAPASAGGESVKHVVRSGETLGSIARTYGVRTADIAVANSISDPAKIRAGTELIIPGWTATGSRNGQPGGSSRGGEAPKSSAPAPVASPFGPRPPEPAPTQPAEVPVIRIDDGPVSPISPAPKQ